MWLRFIMQIQKFVGVPNQWREQSTLSTTIFFIKLRMTTVLTIQFPDKPIVQIVSNTIARINTV